MTIPAECANPPINPLPCGQFVLSFDLELAWGHFDCNNMSLLAAKGKHERRAVDTLLDILDDYGISATWAVVGHMLLEGYDEMLPYPPAAWVNNYPCLAQLYRTSSPYLYGADLIARVLARSSRHEIGFHGFTHRILGDGALSRAEAEAEILAWLRAAAIFGVEPRSVVFPRNRIGHLDLFHQYGFLCYRGVEQQPGCCRLPLLGALLRRSYYYVSVFSTPPLYAGEITDSGLINLPSTRWLFGFNRSLDRFLDRWHVGRARLARTRRAVHTAAAQNKIIHIWAHPYEFESRHDFDKLRYLLDSVAAEVARGRMESTTMAQLAKKLMPVRQANEA